MPHENAITIRPATPADAPQLLRLINALAEYEKLDPPTPEAQERLIRDAFSPAPRFHVLLAQAADGQLAGYAFIMETYSTFLAKPTLYLEDLFIHPDFRGTGAGSAMFSAIKAEAKKRGCGRIEFVVLDWNNLAREFYHRKGGKHMKDWVFYRVDETEF